MLRHHSAIIAKPSGGRDVRIATASMSLTRTGRPEFSWVTLADPEGNEFDVLAGRRP